jgi:DeoR/GlpR family transcriptional regulator of sugar metabolism
VTADERHRVILELLRERQVMSVGDLSRTTGVSEMTIRRDIIDLDRRGQVLRYHGGVAATRSSTYEPPFFVRQAENMPGKAAVGRAIAGMIGHGEVIFLDVGNTPLQVAQYLQPGMGITVVTNWMPIAGALSQRGGFHVHLLGGTVREKELSLIGSTTLENLRTFYFDRAIIGLGGVSLERGLTDYHLDEVAVKRAVLRQAQRVIYAADSGKFGRTAPIEVSPLVPGHHIVTSQGAPADLATTLEMRGLQVTVAPLLLEAPRQ